MADLEGRSIKGYDFQDRLGGGGFGEVYRASQPLLKREVAVKVILPQYANQPDFIRRFEVEAELVARLEHPYIVPIFDFWRDADGAFIVMRMLRGGSLEDLIDSGPMPVELVARVLDQIAAALNIAHRNGVVHRDMKPANILMDEDQNAYLADFGIAKDLGADTSSATVEGLLTPNYAAPEQFKGEAVTAQTDIYNLGLMLYEMLTGQPPYSGQLHELVFKHISDPLPSLLDVMPDLPADLDTVLGIASAKDPAERYPNVLSLALAFKQAIGAGSGDEVGTIEISPADLERLHAATIVEDVATLENPYKGLRAFREGDAEDFFGRDDMIQRLLQRLNLSEAHDRFLAVVGPSGSGKSSVVKAGLIPRLRRGAFAGSDEWFISEMFPGANPLVELEAALLRVAINPPSSLRDQLGEDDEGLMRALKRIMPDDDSELVLIIDQFEELFTQVENEAARAHFLRSLRTALLDPRSRLRVIVTIRADFYDRPLQYESLGELMRRRTEVVLPLSAADLERAILGPAERVGVTLESGLVETIIEDVGEQPGTLPLLQYALTELFERRRGRVLTLEAYRDIGGVTGALARRADELYRDFDAAAKEATRQLFLRLVTLGEGTEDTRRRVRRSEIGGDAAMDRVIEVFGQYRLLTFDRDPVTRGPTVEVAHEALIRTWERLREWIEASRDDLRVQRRLTAATAEWEASGRNRDFLASGARLTQFEEWSQGTELSLNDDERAFLETSIQEEAAKRARDEAIARQVQNFRRAAIVLGGMIVLAIIATVFLLNQASTAQNQANVAQTQVADAGATLTPVQGTVQAAEGAVNAANMQASTAQAQLDGAQEQLDNVGATLTPAQGTVIAAQQDVIVANALASTAQSQANDAQDLAENVGLTLTPVQNTVVAAESAANNANMQASTAQAQVDNVGLTLTPVLGTASAAQSAALAANALASTAQSQVDNVGLTLTPQQATVAAAEDQVNNVGLTLTPVQGTVVAAEDAAISANLLASTAQAQVDSIGLTLTPQQATIAAAEEQVNSIGATLTPVLGTASAAQNAAIVANALASTAQSQVDNVGLTLTPQQATVAAAQDQVNNVGMTLTPVQGTVVAAINAADSANLLASTAQAQVDSVGATLTPQQGTIVAAQEQVNNVGMTLTPVQATVVAAIDAADSANVLVSTAQAQIDSVGATLTPQQATIAAAQEQVNNVGQTLTPVQGTVAAAQEQVNNVGLTLTPQQATIAAAQDQVNNVGMTLTPVQATVVAASNNARSISLSVSAEEAINNGNYDLALALVLESIRLNPGLTQPQRVLGQIAFGSPRLSIEQVRTVAFSPNNRVVAAGQGATVLIWDLETRQVIDTLEGHSGAVLDIAFNANGSLLATGGQDAQAILWDTTPWLSGGRATIAQQLSGHGGAVNAVAFNPDGAILVTGSEDTRIRSWDVRGGTQILTFEATWPVQELRYAEGGRDFFSWANAGPTQIFSLWNGATGSRLLSTENTAPEVFSPNMRNALSGGLNTPLQVLNAGQLSVVREFTRGFYWGTDSVSAADFIGQTGSQLLVGLETSNNANRLVLADVGSGEILRQFEGEGAGRVNAVAVSPDGTLALTGFGNELRLWDIERGTTLRRLAAHNDLVDSIQFSPDGRYAISRSRDNNVRIWDITGGDSAEELRIRAETQIATANFPGLHPQRNTAYAGVWIDIFEWSAQNAQQSNRVSVGAEILNMLYHPTQGQAVTILDNVAILWNLDAGTSGLVNRFANNDDLMRGAGAFSPNGDWLVLDGRSQIYIYEMASQRRTVNINKPQLPTGHYMTDLAVSPDGRLVVGSSGDPGIEDNAPGDIFIWDGSTGDLLLTLPPEHTRTVNSVEISPDGQTLLSASDDNMLILWDLATGQVLKRFAGHTDDVNIGLFNPNPERPFIISASDDATIILWDIASGLPLRRFQGHTTPVTGLNLSADGLRMISSTGSDSMIVWRIQTPQEVIDWTLANRFVRPFSPDECVQYNVPNCNATIAVAPEAPTLEAIPTLPVQATEIPADQPTLETIATLVPSPTVAAEQAQVFAVNSGSQNVNVRASDSTQAGVVAMLAANERVQVLGISNRGTNWYQIMLGDGRLAWVSGTVIRLEGDSAALPQIDPPPVVAPPPAQNNNPPAATPASGDSSSGETPAQPTEESASAYDCSAFRLTSPIGYINNGTTTFYWDPLPGVTADYWVSVFNEAGQQVALSNVGNAFSATIDTSAAAIGPGFTFSYEVNVFVNGAAVCPGSGSVGQRPS